MATQNDKIIGRLYEQQMLEKIYKSSRAEFMALYGRRRVGKTYLIRRFFVNKECIYFQATGIKDCYRLKSLGDASVRVNLSVLANKQIIGSVMKSSIR